MYVEKDRTEPIEIDEGGEGVVEDDPVRADQRCQAVLGPVLEAKNMHHALDDDIQLTRREENPQRQLWMAKDAAEQSAQTPKAIPAHQGRHGGFAEDHAGPQAELARRLQLIERRPNRLESGDVHNLDQKLAGHASGLLPGPAPLREYVQLVTKLVHPVRVEYVALEGIEVHQLSQGAGQLVRSAGERGPAQCEAPFAQARGLQRALEAVPPPQRLDQERQGPDQSRVPVALSRLADCECLAQQSDRIFRAKFDRVVRLPLQALSSFLGLVLVTLRHHGSRKRAVSE
jgi:hypothetical protein